MADIFISYNREDMTVAKCFQRGLEQEGLSVWWDQSLQAGEAYDEVTEAALRGAKAVVVLWSPRSVVSRWVRAEATLADRAKTLLPILIEPCERPIMFELTQTTELIGWNGDLADPAWRRLVLDARDFIARASDAAPASSASPLPAAHHHARRGEAPSLAVMPFTNRSGLSEDEAFAYGLSEDLIDAMSEGANVRVIASSATARFREDPLLDLQEMARQLGVRYVLEGNVRRGGDSIRVGAQLIEAASGEIVWTQRFERPLAELAELQNELIIEAAGSLGANIYRLEMERALRKPSELTAWECVARAMAANRHITAENMQLALAEAQRAVEIAPDYGLGYSMLALTDGGLYYLTRYDSPEEAERIQGHIDRALSLDPDNAAVLANVAAASAYIARPDRGLILGEKATRLRAGFGFAHYGAGISATLLDRCELAIDHLSEFLHLEPQSHLQFVNQGWLSIAHLRAGQFEAARAAAELSLRLEPGYFGGQLVLALSLCELGQRDQAWTLLADLQTKGNVFVFEFLEMRLARFFAGNPCTIRMIGHLQQFALREPKRDMVRN